MRPQAGDARSLGKDGLRVKSDDAAVEAVRADPRAIACLAALSFVVLNMEDTDSHGEALLLV